MSAKINAQLRPLVRPIQALRLDERNARTHDERNLKAIADSLARFGQQKPCIALADGRVLAGNGTVMAALRLGWTELAVVVFDDEDAAAAAGYAIADNRTSDLSRFERDPLLAALAEAEAGGVAPELLGFTDHDLDALRQADSMVHFEFEVARDEARAERRAAEAAAAQPVQDAEPVEPPSAPRSRPGDLWTLGDHRLLCGDSTQAASYARLLGDERAMLLATDPPYLVDYQGGNHPQSWANKDANKDAHWDDYTDPDSGIAFYEQFMAAALAHCVERVPVYQWHAAQRQMLVELAWKKCGLLFHQQIIWVKARPVLGRGHFMWQHEPCLYGWRQGSMPELGRRPEVGASATTFWPIDQVGQQDGIHPTQKPLEIFARPIKWHTKPGEVVLEPFSGSGSQLIAAEQLGRRCRAIELSPAFVDVAVRRWQAATGKRAVRHDGVPFDAVEAQ